MRRPPNQQPQQQPLNEKNVIRQKVLLVERFINFMIIVRMYLITIPLWLWVILLVLLYALKLRREGNIPSSLLVIAAMLCSIFGDLFKIQIVYLMGPILAGISHFFSFKIYWFPKIVSPVGMRQDILENEIYLMELYPIKKNENLLKRVIKWNYRMEIKRIMERQEAKGPIYRAFTRFLISAWDKVKIILAEGDEQPTDQSIIFSHGRGATPLIYSQLLTRMVACGQQHFNILSVQHTEKSNTGETDQNLIKKYREIEVQVRAAQMFSSIQYCKKNKMVLMGHSYGGATVVQTYHCLSQPQKQKITHMVLLDPWFFPLTDTKLTQQITCPILILANEYFLQNQHVYKRNIQFLKAHQNSKVIYLAWKKADHLHQTDMGFVAGNILGRCRNSELSLEMLEKNLKAVRMFLEEKNVTEEKMREVFRDDVLPVDFKPKEWRNVLTL